MTRHLLTDRSDKEVMWVQRRSFLQAATLWTTMGGGAGALAQQRSNIVTLEGDAMVNGSRLDPKQRIRVGDHLETGPDSQMVFVVGNTSFLLRQNSSMTLERSTSPNFVSLMRLVTGAVASVWAKGKQRKIITPTLTIGIRGTGVYTEVLPQNEGRSYFCNCYGTVDLAAGGESVVSQAQYHQAFWVEPEPKEGRSFSPAKKLNHTDEEMEMLAQLVKERTAWQISGRKGNDDPNMAY